MSLSAIREAAEADLVSFIRLVAPQTVLGSVHEELCGWWTRQDRKPMQIVLLPRDHQKSRLVAYRVAWYLTNHPDHRILYISSTANLAEKQLKFIKDVLESRIYQRYWPDHVNHDEGKRERWTNTEISLDHPLRKSEGVRDPSVFTGGLTTSLTGLHCDVAVLDDVVVHENAYTREGRNKVKQQYSLLASIEGTDAEEWVVGTRYDPNDLYQSIIEMMEDIYDEDGVVIAQEPIYEKFERQVEDIGDGSGEFLWPRQQRRDGKYFGFDRQQLAKKRGKYLDRRQYYAQYYNNPNDPENERFSSDKFQYYDKKHVTRSNGIWYVQGNRINVYAAIDFAYSLTKRSDYTAIVVVGVDAFGNYYVLDINRFKTDRIKDYYDAILDMHSRWGFRKLRAEVTGGQAAIVKDLKVNYIKPNGLSLSIDEHRPTRYDGAKEERIRAALEARYDNMAMWHYQGGNCQILEDELKLDKPPHDDVKDALACAVEIAVPPSQQQHSASGSESNVVEFNSRFGGVNY